MFLKYATTCGRKNNRSSSRPKHMQKNISSLLGIENYKSG
jgi:hypothetical protein